MNLDRIFENNDKWVKDKLEQDPDYFADLSKGQAPEILYIGCADEAKYKRLVELNVQEQCINVIKTAEVQSAYKARNLTVHGWGFDIQSGKLIDLKINFRKVLDDVMAIYRLGDE